MSFKYQCRHLRWAGEQKNMSLHTLGPNVKKSSGQRTKKHAGQRRKKAWTGQAPSFSISVQTKVNDPSKRPQTEKLLKNEKVNHHFKRCQAKRTSDSKPVHSLHRIAQIKIPNLTILERNVNFRNSKR